MKKPWEIRLFERCVPQSNGCWRWAGSFTSGGYGLIYVKGKMRLAHRSSYVARHGAIPSGLDLDHLCNTPACVNPDHLEPVTRAENQRRRAERQTHCVRGHERNEENTYRRPGSGSATCRICARESIANKRALKRGKEVAA